MSVVEIQHLETFHSLSISTGFSTRRILCIWSHSRWSGCYQFEYNVLLWFQPRWVLVLTFVHSGSDCLSAVSGCPYKKRDDPGNLQFDWLDVQLKMFRKKGMQVRLLAATWGLNEYDHWTDIKVWISGGPILATNQMPQINVTRRRPCTAYTRKLFPRMRECPLHCICCMRWSFGCLESCSTSDM